MADDRVAAAVAELYGADPDAFTERRKALVLAAREAGDKRSAAAITALRKGDAGMLEAVNGRSKFSGPLMPKRRPVPMAMSVHRNCTAWNWPMN